MVRKKRRRSNVAVIIVRIVLISAFLFYCLLLNHSFPTNPNRITNCFKLFSLLHLTTTLLLRRFLIFEEIEALGKPLEKYVAGVALEELQLMTEVLNDHDIVQQLREALDNSSTMTATEQTELLKKTLAKGK